MSGIDDLIIELCPRGVPHVALADLATTVSGLSGKTKADFTGGACRYVSYKNVYANLAVDQTASDFVVVRASERQNELRKGDVLITGSSENLEDVGMSSVVVSEPAEPLYLNSFCFALRLKEPQLLLPGFSKYLFRGEGVREQIRRAASGVTRINISKERFMKTRVPLPPLEVQREVMRVLDRYTELEEELRRNLSAEQDARRVQHEHYRRDLLDASAAEGQLVRLGDVASLQIGFPFKSSQFSADTLDTRLIRGDNIGQGFLHEREFKRWRRAGGDNLAAYEMQAGDIVLAMDRPWVAAGLKWAQLTETDLPSLLVQRVARLRADAEVLDQNYLARVIASPEFTRHILGSQAGNTVPHISRAHIAGFTFPLPTLVDQADIAAVIRKYDQLANDLNVGLSAERAARRAQYEHYRNRLLTFEDLAA